MRYSMSAMKVDSEENPLLADLVPLDEIWGDIWIYGLINCLNVCISCYISHNYMF